MSFTNGETLSYAMSKAFGFTLLLKPSA